MAKINCSLGCDTDCDTQRSHTYEGRFFLSVGSKGFYIPKHQYDQLVNVHGKEPYEVAGRECQLFEV